MPDSNAVEHELIIHEPGFQDLGKPGRPQVVSGVDSMVASNQLNLMTAGRGRMTETRTDPNWGSAPSRIKNPGWFEGRKYTAGQLSLGHKTDQQYYVYDATGMVIKGHCDYDEIARALDEEGLASNTVDRRSTWL